MGAPCDDHPETTEQIIVRSPMPFPPRVNEQTKADPSKQDLLVVPSSPTPMIEDDSCIYSPFASGMNKSDDWEESSASALTQIEETSDFEEVLQEVLEDVLETETSFDTLGAAKTAFETMISFLHSTVAAVETSFDWLDAAETAAENTTSSETLGSTLQP